MCKNTHNLLKKEETENGLESGMVFAFIFETSKL